jgi:hypothetical protein
MSPLNLDSPYPCPDCGAALAVTEFPADEDDPATWSTDCPACLWVMDGHTEPPTFRTRAKDDHVVAALVAEIDRLRGGA